MGRIILEHKFNIGDEVIVSGGYIVGADADPMGSPGTNLRGSTGTVEGINISHRIGQTFNQTSVRYSVNGYSFPEELLSTKEIK